ncbi:MAG: hypothetical protein OXU20_41195 [Myxococcales bacterium]|nr:hypothetical protein [Myxococcales bacterium]
MCMACVWLLWELREPPPPIDDAYISLCYARNLVEGHGLVWNVGERVEGFSNLPWTLLFAASLAAGASAESAAHVLSTLAGLATLLPCYDLTRRCLVRTPLAENSTRNPPVVFRGGAFGTG